MKIEEKNKWIMTDKSAGGKELRKQVSFLVDASEWRVYEGQSLETNKLIFNKT